MRCDTNGNLYVTRPGAGAVAVLRPDGVIDRTVHLPGLQCTNLCFGGGDGRTCYVTLADRGTLAAFRAPTPGQEWRLWQSG